MLTRLLTADTRAIELTSALSFFLISLATIVAPIIGTADSITLQYAVTFFVIGVLQVLAIACNLLFSLRIILNYISGIIWVWLGLSMFSLASIMAHCSAVSVALGIGNFYAFVIGVGFLVKNKKEQGSNLNG